MRQLCFLIFTLLLAGPAFAGQYQAMPPQAATAAVLGTEPVQIATLDRRTGRTTNFRRELVATSFPDGMKINSSAIERMGKNYYLVVRGGEGNRCRVSRVQLDTGPDGQMRMRQNRTTESCSGNPCTRCGFVSAGGNSSCSCKDGSAGGRCNHTISTGFHMLTTAGVARE